jgi:hypothetical protein
MQLGELKKVELREIWAHEALDFTKWLVQEDNLEKINEVVGLTLVNIRSEVSVGGYKVDIMCEDATTGNQVVIENQLTQTDHSHLGQIITYASGLDAKYIIWIVKSVRDEHQSAIEWLNKYTTKDIHFFLIRVEVWKIEESAPAVKFSVIEQPNDWSKMVKSEKTDNKITERKVLIKEFWIVLNEVIEERNSFKTRKPSMDHWYSLPIRSSLCHLSISIIAKERKIRLELHIPNNKRIYDYFFKHKEEIEKVFGEDLIWDRLENKKASRIETYIKGFNLSDSNTHHQYATKSIQIIEKMREAFAPYIPQIRDIQ